MERPDWLARVIESGSHPAWKNTPVATAVETGTTLEAVNVGGRPHTFPGVGEQRYQCCFHPWMRTTVKVTESHGH